MPNHDNCHGVYDGVMPSKPTSSSTAAPSGQLPTAVMTETTHGVATARRTRHMWIYTLLSVWFVYLMFGFFFGFSIQLGVETYGPWWGALLHVLNAVSMVGAAVLMLHLKNGFGSTLPRKWTIMMVISASCLFLIALLHPAVSMMLWGPLILGLSLVVGFLQPPWRRRATYWLFGFVALLLVLNSSALLEANVLWEFVFLIFMMPALTLASIWYWDVIIRINEASTLSAQLATTTERLRIAADLHDIQGHNLQVIALEAELADRLITTNPARAQEHIRKVRHLVKTSQQEATTLIRGLRQADVAVETANAVDVLQAAGIVVTSTGTPPQLSQQAQQLYSALLREASTNILRHSNASSVNLHWAWNINEYSLIIRNDGVLNDDGEAVRTKRAESIGSGTGLASLADRFTQTGGELTTTRDGASFQLVATMRDEVKP